MADPRWDTIEEFVAYYASVSEHVPVGKHAREVLAVVGQLRDRAAATVAELKAERAEVARLREALSWWYDQDVRKRSGMDYTHG